MKENSSIIVPLKVWRFGARCMTEGIATAGIEMVRLMVRILGKDAMPVELLNDFAAAMKKEGVKVATDPAEIRRLDIQSAKWLRRGIYFFSWYIMIEAAQSWKLSPGQLEMLRVVFDNPEGGHKDYASALGITENAVGERLKALYAKAGVHGKEGLLAKFFKTVPLSPIR